ncbi:MAG TPA: glycosyltransferase family 1 protein [Woeseiaceae bacterium]|nr:glycosyltransferase family 1 protein [Woeseiaceae bacterium]
MSAADNAQQMKIAVVTDAWLPQVNGVVTTLLRTREELTALGHEVLMITPEGRRTVRCPTYPEIRLSLFEGRSVARQLEQFSPESIHIATEGPLGMATRRWCLKRRFPFTTSYHTQFPEYVRARVPVPIRWSFAFLRHYHGAAERTLVPTSSIKNMLDERGFRNVEIWSRGVDTDTFRPDRKKVFDWPRPVWINVGRVAVEKSIDQFLELDLPGSKVVVGDGPERERLQQRYPDCHFLGYKFGAELAAHLAAADVFVFPSRTDTFGLVMLEAMACGVPVAALPVRGPIDVVQNGLTGVLDDNLERACMAALQIDRDACRRFAETRSWRHATEQLLTQLAQRADEVSGVSEIG